MDIPYIRPGRFTATVVRYEELQSFQPGPREERRGEPSFVDCAAKQTPVEPVNRFRYSGNCWRRRRRFLALRWSSAPRFRIPPSAWLAFRNRQYGPSQMKKSHPIILMVDDDPDGLFFLKSAFAAAGISSVIQTVNGGHAAIAYVRGEGEYSDRGIYPFPDFVITDLKMPGVDGFDVLRFLKKNPLTVTLPVVVFSGSQDNYDIRKSYLLGASSYHVKPGSVEALRALARGLLGYWTLCDFPEVDDSGVQVGTDSSHKLGEQTSGRI